MCSAHEYVMFATAQLLCTWHEQWCSKHGDLTQVSQGRLGCLYHAGGPASEFVYTLQYVAVTELCFKQHTLYLFILLWLPSVV
jgi:hypothetical protein